MRQLETAFHPDVSHEDISADSQLSLVVRHAARAVVLRGEDLLLLYTQRYEDYSLPGGGIDDGEDEVAGLIRELTEETGAQGVRNIRPFVRYDEYRPWYKDEADLIHMVSHCYICDIDDELGETAFEQNEIKNGMKPVWMNIYTAIAHNKEVMATSEKQGLSIVRETYLMQVIAQELLVG